MENSFSRLFEILNNEISTPVCKRFFAFLTIALPGLLYYNSYKNLLQTGVFILKYILIYLLIINLLGFLLMGIDKRKAKKNAFRIPEKTLFLSALFGGSIGSLTGMYYFRHKTKHTSFVLGMPCILILQIAFVIFLIYRFIL